MALSISRTAVMSCDGPHVSQIYLYQTNPHQRLNLVDNGKYQAKVGSSVCQERDELYKYSV